MGWVFPKKRKEVPKTPAERKDRKDELRQNSLVEHQLYHIEKVNQWLEEGRLINNSQRENEPGYKTYRKITIKKMPMLLDLPAGAAFVNTPSFIKDMIKYGYDHAYFFLP